MAGFSIADLGDLGGGPSFSEAYGLNDKGQAVGYGTTVTTNVAFVWSSTAKMKALPLPKGSVYSIANGINKNELIVGFAWFPGTGKKAFYWKSGVVRPIPFNGNILSSEATAVNELGEVCGTYREQVTSSLILDTAFTWDSRNASVPAMGITPLPPDAVNGSGIANAINQTGHIAGNALAGLGLHYPSTIAQHCPYLWNPVTGLCKEVVNNPAAAFPGGEARGINTDRLIVGVYNNMGFVWTPGSPSQSVGAVSWLTFEPYDINNKRQIVGVRQGSAVLFDTKSNTLTDLSSLPVVQNAGWTALVTARAINEIGQFVGTGIRNNGDVHGYLLSTDSKGEFRRTEKPKRSTKAAPREN